ncbi:hypothetical protein KHA80_18730 [Anaerobacillus sp. HL2]|nr:hypothetical protein KHA80_18730 [Anaerobacillus sp. HL2]
MKKVVVINENREELEWTVDGAFIFIGRIRPGTEFIKNQLRQMKKSIIVNEKLETNVS